MNKNIRYIVAAALVVCGQQVSAQTDSTTYHESVIVVGDYQPVLDGVSEKVNVAPVTNDNVPDELQPRFTYGITPHRMSALSATSGIKAAKVIASPTRLYNNYLKFGLGHDFSAVADFNPLVDLYYTSTRNEKYAYGARLYHETDVTTGFKGYPERLPLYNWGAAPAVEGAAVDAFGRTRESVTKLDVFGKYILNGKHAFGASLGFDRQYGRYYGFSDSTLMSALGRLRDSIAYGDYAFAYNNLALNLSAKSLNTDVNKLGYEAHVGLADLWSRWDATQLSAQLDGSVHYGFPMFSKYKAVAYLHANWQGYRQRYEVVQTLDALPLGYDATATGWPDSVKTGRSLLTINPYVDFLFKDFKIHAGLAFGFNGFDGDETTHNLLPDLTVSKSFSNNSMSLTLGFVGNYVANDWNTIRQFNPYVAPAPLAQATVDNNLFAHLRINFSKRLILNLSADNHFQQNGLFFALDPHYALQNVFTPRYVDLNDLVLGAELTFVNDEMITLTTGLDYYLYYNLPEACVLLYTPDVTAHLDARINYKDKWFFTLQTLFVSRVDAEEALNAQGVREASMTLPAHVGARLEVEYLHSKALSFFARFDNVGFQRYYLWANYPAQRFGAMLGLTYTIPTKK
ncbi:MAG: hypothetical protein IJM88_08185 [Bacteroidales bacterium]|nr:hypothetical protein [Bacteroidales bacterium]